MSDLTHKAIDRPRLTFVIAMALMFWGLGSLLTIPIEQNPRLRIPVVLVVVPYPGATPDEVEDNITREVEKELRGLKGLKKMSSVSQDSASVVVLEFRDDITIKDARRDVQQAVDRARPELPDEAEVPLVDDIAVEDLPILQISLFGPVPLQRLKRIAEDWSEPIEGIKGVAAVEIFGGLEREVVVEGDAARLEHYGLTLFDLARSIAAAHRNLPGGAVDLPARELRVRTLGQLAAPEEFANAVARPGERPVRVGDVASVDPAGHARRTSISRVNGFPGVTLLIKKQVDINTLETLDAVKSTVADLAEALPPGVEMVLAGDADREIGYMVDQLTQSALFGSVLVMLLLFWAIGGRNALLVGLAIPGSLLIGMIFIHGSGLVFSGVCIFGLILILGMVVDGAVIVAENIYRHVEMGKDPHQAAHDGMEEIGVSIFTADLTTISAFLPLLFVVGVTGQFMAVLPKVVAFALCGSIIMDHYVLPVAAAYTMKRSTGEHRTGPLMAVVLVVYRRVLQSALALPWLVALVAFGAFGVAMGVVATGALGAEFFPKVDVGKFDINIEMPAGSSIERTDEAARAIEAQLAELPEAEISSIVTTIGETGALNADFREGTRSGPEHARIRVELVRPRFRERNQSQIVAQTRSLMDGVAPGALLSIHERREGPPVGSAIAIYLQGDDLDAIYRAARLVERVGRESAMVRDVKNDFVRGRPELQVDVDHQLAALFGVTPAEVARAVAIAYRGDTETEMTIGDSEVDVRVRLADVGRLDLSEVEALPIRAGARPVLLGQLARVRLAHGLSEINRLDGTRTATIRCEPADGVDVAVALAHFRQAIEAERAAGRMPSEVAVVYGGENEEEAEALASLRGAMGLALLLVLLILIFQFNSFRQTFVILSTVPLALIGVVLGMFVLGYKLGFLPFVGVVSLTGIVVNDAIVLVDFANQARRRGLDTVEALMEAGAARFRPVLLTTVTTIGGLIPLAFNLAGGGEFWAPLCWAIICGLAMALPLTLVVVPALYLVVTGRGARPPA